MIECPWEVTDEKDDEDWFYKSISAYNHLLMYNLPLQPEHLVLNPAGTCLALSGKNSRSADKNEIAVYRLPSKLLCQTEHEQGLNNSRDFKIAGGVFVDQPLSGLQFISPEAAVFYQEEGESGKEELAVSLTGGRGVEVWQLREQEDDLVLKYKIDTNLAPHSWQIAQQTLIASDGESVEHIDLVSKQQISQVSLGVKGVSSKVVKAGHLTYIGSGEGRISCVDQRSGKVCGSMEFNQSITSSPDTTPRWSWDVYSGTNDSIDILALDDTGELFRASSNLKSVQQIGRLGSSTGILTTNHQTRTASNKQTTNRFAIHSDQLVRVYEVEGDVVQEVFVHEGHATSKLQPRVKNCCFHPWLENTLISTDTARNLQIWQFNDNRKKA